MTPPPLPTIGARFREVRRANNLTQVDFSKSIGISQSALVSYERGEREPPAAAIAALSETYNLSADWILLGRGDQSRSALNMSFSTLTNAEKTHLTLALVEQCVRNTFLEVLHSGTFPDSQPGDYSDVQVISPYGQIPWTNLSRISDAEMKQLMIEVCNKVFTFLSYPNELDRLGPAARWNTPTFDVDLQRVAKRRQAL